MSEPKSAKGVDPSPPTEFKAAEGKPDDLPIPKAAAKVLMAALLGAGLALDVQAAALLLSILIVSKGQAWAAKVEAKELVEISRAFAHQNPIAWHAMLRGNVMGMARGLILNSVETASVEEYTRLASVLSAAA